MLKTLAQLEYKVEDRAYQLLCGANAPLSEVKDALAQFMGHVIAIENSIRAQKSVSENPPVEPPVVDESVKSDPQE